MVSISASIAIQAILLGLAFITLVLRGWARVLAQQSVWALADVLAWAGWVFTLGWFICSTMALRILIDNPAQTEELIVESVEYLKIVFVAQYFFDIGIYFPKLSITLFYWSLIPRIMGRLRNALIGVSVYLCCCLVATILLDTLICQPISDNWSIPNQLKSVWNSYTAFVVQWVLNWSTDLVAFLYPFFLLKHISLRKEQKLALIGVFSLGAITLSVSLARFVAYNATDFELEDESGNILSTAEMATGVIVVCLPGLRRFIGRSKSPVQSSGPSGPSSGYVQTIGNNNTQRTRQPPSAYQKWGVRDDEIGLVTEIRAGDSTELTDMERSSDGKSVRAIQLSRRGTDTLFILRRNNYAPKYLIPENIE
ncbi:hypothetical protein NW752_001647 [Fusarium irregulare]|nr:hypothetical protein NW752_001647 [Fusarium irregulare]